MNPELTPPNDSRANSALDEIGGVNLIAVRN
jgi:hypothetical protein